MPFLLVAGILCAAPIRTNKTAFPWNAHDEDILKSAQEGCRVSYPDTSPCLKELIKVGEQDYNAICKERLR